jgi:hypothetical protein
MNRFGRINMVLVVGIMVVVLLAFVIFVTRESVTTVGSRFMSALAKGDVNTLTEMTYLDGRGKEDVRKQWEFSVNEVGKHYRFAWKISSANESNGENAAVRLQVIRDLENPSAFEENFQLPLRKENGQWKVDVSNISRDMFPALPR